MQTAVWQSRCYFRQRLQSPGEQIHQTKNKTCAQQKNSKCIFCFLCVWHSRVLINWQKLKGWKLALFEEVEQRGWHDALGNWVSQNLKRVGAHNWWWMLLAQKTHNYNFMTSFKWRRYFFLLVEGKIEKKWSDLPGYLSPCVFFWSHNFVVHAQKKSVMAPWEANLKTQKVRTGQVSRFLREAKHRSFLLITDKNRLLNMLLAYTEPWLHLLHAGAYLSSGKATKTPREIFSPHVRKHALGSSCWEWKPHCGRLSLRVWPSEEARTYSQQELPMYQTISS